VRASATAFLKREFRYSLLLSFILLCALSLRLLPLRPADILIFDEVYYASAKSVTELLGSIPHPPVALYMIKCFSGIWGFFGWRTGGALIGTASLFIFYLLARRFLSPAFSLVATCLLSLDFLNFILCRLAMLDIYAFFLPCLPLQFSFIRMSTLDISHCRGMV